MQCGVGDVWQKMNSRLCESRRHLGPRTQSFSTASAQKRRPLLSQCLPARTILAELGHGGSRDRKRG